MAKEENPWDDKAGAGHRLRCGPALTPMDSIIPVFRPGYRENRSPSIKRREKVRNQGCWGLGGGGVVFLAMPPRVPLSYLPTS